MLSANPIFVKKPRRVIPHYISAVKNEQQRAFPKVMQETGRMSNQIHRAFLMKSSGTPSPGSQMRNPHSPWPHCSTLAAGCMQRVLCSQHPTPSRQNHGEEGSGQPQNKMPQVLTADKHVGSFPTGSGGLKCILPEKEKRGKAAAKQKQVMRGWAGGTVKQGSGE